MRYRSLLSTVLSERRRHLRPFATAGLAAGCLFGISVAEAGESAGTGQLIRPVGYGCDSCDGYGTGCCEGCRRRGSTGCRQSHRSGRLKAAFASRPFHEHYCTGCGSAPAQCNPPVRRVPVAVSRPTPAPAVAPGPAIFPDEPILGTPIEFADPGVDRFVMPSPTDRVATPINREAVADDVVTEPLRSDPAASPTQPSVGEDETPPPVPPQAMQEPPEPASELDAAGDAGDAGGQPGQKRTGGQEQPTEGSQPVPDLDGIETSEQDVSYLPPGGWHSAGSTPPIDSQPYFPAGEPDLVGPRYGAAKPFGLYD